MALGHLKPKAVVLGAVPAGISDVNSSFSMQVLGWEIGRPSGSAASDDWLVVGIQVNSGGREWSAEAAPFGAGALSPLANWLTALADGKEVPALGYDDPEIEWSGAAADSEARTLAVTLRSFYVPEELDASDQPFTITMSIRPQQLTDFAQAIGAQADLL